MSECSFRAAGKRKSNQRCHNISISSRQWRKEGQILPVLQVTGTGCLALVPSHKHRAVMGTNRGGCRLCKAGTVQSLQHGSSGQAPGTGLFWLPRKAAVSCLAFFFFFSDLVHLGCWTLQTTWCESGPAAHAAPKAASLACLFLLEAPRSHLCGLLPLLFSFSPL